MSSKRWNKSTRYLVFILLLAASIWLAINASDLVESLAISALLAYILNPLVTFVNRRAKVSRNWVVLFVYIISLSTLVTLGIIFVPVIPEETANLIRQFQEIVAQVEADYLSEPVTFLTFEISLVPLLPDISALSPDSLIRPDIILDAVQATSTNIGWILVISVSTFYLLQDWGRLREWLFQWIPEGYNTDSRRLYSEVNGVWSRYFRGQLRLSLIIGILTGLGTAAVGLPGAVIFGIFAGIFDVLLSVGPVLVTIVAAFVALFAGSSFLPVTNVVFMLIVVGIFTAIQIAENLWLRPRIMGHSLNIHPAVVFIAIIASLALAGVLTALIIIPVLASVGVIVRYLHAKIFDLDPWPEVVRSDNSRSQKQAAPPVLEKSGQ